MIEIMLILFQKELGRVSKQVADLVCIFCFVINILNEYDPILCVCRKLVLAEFFFW